LIDWSCCHSYAQQRHRRDRPHVYSTTIILRCFIVRIWLRLDSNRALHNYLSIIDLPYNRKVMKACEYQYCHYYHVGVLLIRLKTISVDIKERITTMGCLFVIAEGIVKPYIIAIDIVHSYQGSWESMAQIIHEQRNSASFRYRYRDAR
jgi:hypothetical protein